MHVNNFNRYCHIVFKRICTHINWYSHQQEYFFFLSLLPTYIIRVKFASVNGWTVEHIVLVFVSQISFYMLWPSFLWIAYLCCLFSFWVLILGIFVTDLLFQFGFMSCLEFYPFEECENFLPFCLWLYFLHLDFNPSGINFCVCCEVGIILYFFPKWITSWSDTIYWIINLLFTDLKYHLYHILNPHIFLDLFLGSVLFLGCFVYYCAGTAPL